MQNFKLIAATSCCATARTGVFERKNYEVCTIEYVISGGGFVELNGRPAEYVNADSVYFLPKHSNHAYYPDSVDPWNKYFFVVDGELMESLMAAYGLSDHTVITNASSLKRFFLEFIQLSEHIDNASGSAALLFHEFLSACRTLLLQQQQPIPDAAGKLRQQLEKDPADKFLLKDYAQSVNLSSEHLIRLFYKRFGITPQACRLRFRLEEASRLLRYSDLSVKEIAGMVGFADQYSFSNRFKQYYKISPVNFRREHSNCVKMPLN